MSSILDALKKIEAKKQTAAKATSRIIFNRDAVEPEHSKPTVTSNRLTIHITPTAVIAGAVVFGLIQVTAFLGAFVLVAGSNAAWRSSTTPVAANVVPSDTSGKPAPSSALSGDKTPSAEGKGAPLAKMASANTESSKTIPAPGATAKKTEAPNAAKKAENNAPKSIPLPNIELMPDPAKPGTPGPMASATPPSPVKTAELAPPMPVTPPSKSLKDIGPVDINALPLLSEGDRVRCGLKDVQVNLPRPADKTRPVASAIINLRPVHVGEAIPNTRAILIGVDMRGVGIEVQETGERFLIRF